MVVGRPKPRIEVKQLMDGRFAVYDRGVVRHVCYDLDECRRWLIAVEPSTHDGDEVKALGRALRYT